MANSLGWTRAEWQAKRLELFIFGLGHVAGWLVSAFVGLLLIYPDGITGTFALGMIVAAVFTAPVYLGAFWVVRWVVLTWGSQFGRMVRNGFTLAGTVLASGAGMFALGKGLIYLFFHLFPRMFS